MLETFLSTLRAYFTQQFQPKVVLSPEVKREVENMKHVITTPNRD